jgi:hypothetical protein
MTRTGQTLEGGEVMQALVGRGREREGKGGMGGNRMGEEATSGGSVRKKYLHRHQPLQMHP